MEVVAIEVKVRGRKAWKCEVIEVVTRGRRGGAHTKADPMRVG
jgi:hypothetical protein